MLSSANRIQLPRLGEPEAHELAERAFEDGEHAALFEAHRALYAIYAARVWRPISDGAGDPDELEALRPIRRILERAFRARLDRQREEVGFDFGSGGNLGEQFQRLAIGEHPLDDGAWSSYVCNHASLEAMRRVVAQRALFFLREPDPWIYAVPTLTGQAKAGLIDLLLDEYGWGKCERMHSSVYANVMTALELDTTLDAYEDATSWQYLATLNHQWMCALDPALSRRLIGTIYLTEADSPGAMTNYLTAWQRLGVSDERVTEFYDLHVHADENHRDVALGEVALPVAEAEGPAAALEIAKGIFDGRALEAEFAAGEIALAEFAEFAGAAPADAA